MKIVVFDLVFHTVIFAPERGTRIAQLAPTIFVVQRDDVTDGQFTAIIISESSDSLSREIN